MRAVNDSDKTADTKGATFGAVELDDILAAAKHKLTAILVGLTLRAVVSKYTTCAKDATSGAILVLGNRQARLTPSAQKPASHRIASTRAPTRTILTDLKEITQARLPIAERHCSKRACQAAAIVVVDQDAVRSGPVHRQGRSRSHRP
jgi:hypothetical protein